MKRVGFSRKDYGVWENLNNSLDSISQTQIPFIRFRTGSQVPIDGLASGFCIPLARVACRAGWGPIQSTSSYGLV